MCPWVGSHASYCGRQLLGVPSRAEYLSKQVYCTRESTVQSPHPFGSTCGAPLLGRRPPPWLCAGTPGTGCCHGSG